MGDGATGYGVPYRNDEHKDELVIRLKEIGVKELLVTTKLGFYVVNP